jgi:hypothetical protein
MSKPLTSQATKLYLDCERKLLNNYPIYKLKYVGNDIYNLYFKDINKPTQTYFNFNPSDKKSESLRLFIEKNNYLYIEITSVQQFVEFIKESIKNG